MSRFAYNSDCWGSHDNGYTACEHQVGFFRVYELKSGENRSLSMYVPNNFHSLSKFGVMIIPDTTETIIYDAAVQYAANGEVYTTHTASVADVNLAVTINQITEIDLSALLPAVAAGDYIGLEFASKTDELRIWGMFLRYV